MQTKTREKLYRSDVLAETFKELTINDTGYYESDSANTNEAKGNPVSNLKTVTHTSDGNKRNFMNTRNGDFRKKY